MDYRQSLAIKTKEVGTHWLIFSIKRQMINTFQFASHTVSISTPKCYHCSGKASQTMHKLRAWLCSYRALFTDTAEGCETQHQDAALKKATGREAGREATGNACQGSRGDTPQQRLNVPLMLEL